MAGERLGKGTPRGLLARGSEHEPSVGDCELERLESWQSIICQTFTPRRHHQIGHTKSGKHQGNQGLHRVFGVSCEFSVRCSAFVNKIISENHSDSLCFVRVWYSFLGESRKCIKFDEVRGDNLRWYSVLQSNCVVTIYAAAVSNRAVS